ncbi:acyl-CoA dehydrogenase family protein [Streptomyces sp. GMY02]|uniref:acyl-CoA dehydrogenase family protein n=1 Tax=Streptomyces sp. GMY02 TaxID=1333528 RepID=UPI001C2C2598|nr:acyl-CoA dehydrogenase family protein [Streptomyces sp. GMY02]QXE34200.1 acyl-CoA dehydrogenase family protein [Streptomyces sp. GMY02]
MPVFTLGPAQTEWCAELRALAVERLRPLAEKGKPGRVNRPLIAALGELGLLGQVFGDTGAAGGGGPAGAVGALELCLLRESLAQGCTEAETALALQGLGAYPVVQAGTCSQRARWLPEVSAGRAVAAFALSEPGAGSDAAALALRAVPDGDGWLLTGEKRWISNAPEADFYTVFARTDGAERGRADGTGHGRAEPAGRGRADGTGHGRAGAGAGARGITAFLVPAGRPGLTGTPIEMLAPHAIGALAFDSVPVTPDDVLGEVGHGFRVAMNTLNLFRPSVGAFAVGMAQAALDATLEHIAGRTAFGGPLKDLQAVAHQVAEMATRTEAARLLVYAAAEAYDSGAPGVPRRSAMAKLFATETAQYVVDSAVQLHGARALQRGHPLEHLYREVRAPRIYEGATEVQRSIIAKELYRERYEREQRYAYEQPPVERDTGRSPAERATTPDTEANA